MRDLAPERRRRADRRKATDERIDQYFVLATGMMIGMLIFMMADAI